MLHFTGQQEFLQRPNKIWEHLVNIEFLARCIPGLEKIENTEPRKLAFHVRPGFSFLQGTLKSTLEIVDEQAPWRLRLLVHSKGIGSSARVEIPLELSTIETGTRLVWTVEIKELGGLLKPLGKSLVTSAAKQVFEDTWQTFHAAINSDMPR